MAYETVTGPLDGSRGDAQSAQITAAIMQSTIVAMKLAGVKSPPSMPSNEELVLDWDTNKPQELVDFRELFDQARVLNATMGGVDKTGS